MTSEVKSQSISFLDESAWEKISDSPYNAPHTFDDAFAVEYWETHAAVKEVVDAFCKDNSTSTPDDAFTMNDDYGQSRWVSVEAHEPLLLCGRLIQKIKGVLETLPTRYLVVLEHDLIEEPFNSIWDIFVTVEKVQAFVKSEDAKNYLTKAEQSGRCNP